MVRIQGATFGDVTDRAARQLGQVYGRRCLDNALSVLPIAGNDGVIVSPKPWWSRDSYGELCEQDDFSGTFKWTPIAGTVTQASDPQYVLTGANAMKLVTGGAAGAQASACRFFNPTISAWPIKTMEFWFCLSAVADATPRDFYMKWGIENTDSNELETFGIRFLNYDSAVQRRKWQYWDSTGAWVDKMALFVRRPSIIHPQFLYVALQLRCTGSNHYVYNALQMGDFVVNMVSAAPQVGVYSQANQMVEFVATTDVAAVTTAYVGAFILQDGAKDAFS